MKSRTPGGRLAPTLQQPQKESEMPSQAKSFGQPEETRSFENGRVDLVEIAGSNVGRVTLQPGWRWSESVKPIVDTESCQVAHVGYAVSGQLHVVMDDGTEVDIKAGDAYEIPPGHDAWVDGDETYRGVEFESLAEYAKG
jgi:mannose-6-phosphate isomerase-like protein (cupin superfamily)